MLNMEMMQKNKPSLALESFSKIPHFTFPIPYSLTSSPWLPFLSGILLSLTLPMFGVWSLVWVALAPFFLFASNKHISHGRLCAGVFLFGMPYAIAVVYPLMRVTSWWWSAGASSFGMPELELKFACIILLIGFWGAFFFLPLAYILRRFGTHPLSFIIVPLSWVFVEWLRSSFALFGYSWGVLGYTLLDTTYLKHLASLGGVYSLSLLVVLGSVSFVQLVQLFGERTGSFFDRTRSVFRMLIEAPRTHIGAWFFVGCFTCALFFGIFREHHVSAALSACTQGPLRVAVVSSYLSTNDSIGGGAYRDYRRKIEGAFAAGATLIILPENAFPFFELNESDDSLNEHNLIPLREQDELYADFLSISSMHPEATLAVGLHTNNGHTRYNSLVLFQHGKPVTYYHKRKLVPFAEYAPLGLPVPLVMPFNAGVREQYFLAGGVRASALMCSEVSDATIPLRDIGLILSPSNDSVFASDAIALIHHRMARMRALEANAYLLRASKGGISSIIDGNGVTQKEGRDGVLIADIMLGCK
jgi:apolipoprotein N-acyltransferase